MRRRESPGLLRLWHGSSRPLEKFRGDALSGIVHLGSLEQAAMRSGGMHLHLVEVRLDKVKRVRDSGSYRTSAIGKARRAGYDGLVYLNRYEGIPAAHLEAALREKSSLDLDRMCDAGFRKLFPEAKDSYISFDPHSCRILARFETRQEAEAYLEGPAVMPVSRGPWHVGIDYDEDDPTSYRAVEAVCGEERMRFSGKGPEGDWADYLNWARENRVLVLTRSSVQHFCWDVPGWRLIEDASGAEILVPEDRPEWDGHEASP